ncbi:hypothetical protein MNBD_NITROSPINAE01-995 [hydrothermal vent metagenome]|uniref:Cytochrome c domain-containing protein n=1 Tax=hydrothermal vent metagenome TaxID=652676 RepID=A0A3B1BUV1_9ZZZZ
MDLKITTLALFFLSVVMMFAGSAEPGVFSVVDGRKTYNKLCRMCHGGKGVSAVPGATDFRRKFGMLGSDRDMFTVIQDGLRGMPAFLGLLSKDEIRNVIWYLRTIN